MRRNFAITGAVGYAATPHLDAIVRTGNNLVAAVDRSDSVGLLDRYSFDVRFFTVERVARRLVRLAKEIQGTAGLSGVGIALRRVRRNAAMPRLARGRRVAGAPPVRR